MTISVSANNARVRYTATSSQTAFAIPFEFTDNDEITVFVATTALVAAAERGQGTGSTEYGISGGGGATGAIAFVTGITQGHIVTIVRDIPIERTTDFTAGTTINRAALNTQLDNITAMIGDLKDKSDRAIRLQPYDSEITLFLPTINNRAGKIFGFDTNGNLTADTSANFDISLDDVVTNTLTMTGNANSKINLTAVLDSQILTNGAVLNIKSTKGSNTATMTLDGSTTYGIDFNAGNKAIRMQDATLFSSTAEVTGALTAPLIVSQTGGSITLQPTGNQVFIKGTGGQQRITFHNPAAPSMEFTGDSSIIGSGTFLLDVAGDITLDAAGDQIFFKDNGALRLTFNIGAAGTSIECPSELIIKSTANNDISLQSGGGQVNIIGTSGQARLQFDNAASPTMKYSQNSNTTTLGVVDPTGTRTLLLPNESGTIHSSGGATAHTNITVSTDGKVQFRDSAIYIQSGADGHLDLVADTEIQIAATTVNVDGLMDVSGNLSVGGNLDVTGTIDFSDSSITNVGSINLDRIANDGGAGITLDSSVAITIDSANGQNIFKQNGSTRLTFVTASSGIQSLTSAGIFSLIATGDINLRPNGGQLYVLNNSGGDNFQFNTGSSPTLGIHQNSNVTNLGLVNPTATRTLLLPDASDTLVGKATTDTLTNKTLSSAILTSPTITGSLNMSDVSITNVGSIALDTITNDGTDITLDSSGDIVLDAAGDQIFFKDDGNTRLTFNVGASGTSIQSASELTIKATSSDISLQAEGGQVNILGTSGQQRILFDNAASATMQYFQNSNITKLGVVNPTGTRTLLLPDASDTLVGKATTDTLTNKTLTSPKINENVVVTSTATELNLLDGVTSTTAELNILDGVTSTAAELNILDGVTSTAAELNILDGVTSTAAELNILDGVTSTAAELNALDGITAVVGELNALDIGSTAVGTAVASKAVILDSNKDYTGIRNLTMTGTLDLATVEFNSLSGTGSVAITDILDEDNLASNSATKLATQQSIKAYVDANAGGGGETLTEILSNGNRTTTNEKIEFRDAAIFINSSADGQLDIVADTEIQIAATTIDINGAINASGQIIAASLDISGNIDVDGTTNLDVVDIDGAVNMATTLLVTGNVDFNGNLDVDGTTNLDVIDVDGAANFAADVTFANGSDIITSTAGDFNFRAGATAGESIQSGGNQNTVVGNEAGNALTTGDFNAFFGYQAGDLFTTGGATTFIGTKAGNRTTGSVNDNSAFGGFALFFNTTGNGGTAVGRSCLAQNTTGIYNTAVGAFTLDANTTANQSTAMGAFALSAASGSGNVAFGYNAGGAVTSGTNNIFLGLEAGLSGSPGGNITTASNEIGLGDERITAANIQVDWTVASDQRDKTDFTALDLGLDFVKALAPVTYKWDKRSKYGDKSADDYDLNAQTPDGTHKEDWLDIGFKAQEVQALEEAAGYTTAAKKNLTVSTTSDGKQMGLQYSKFVPILVKAIQELSAKNDALVARITTLEGA